MKRSAAILVCCAGLQLAPAQVPQQHHPPADAGEYARILEDPSRDAWQKPREVILALGLKGSEDVADIGAGSGYFARRLAGHARLVYAVDIDAKLLEICARSSPANVKTVLAQPDDPTLGESSADLVFLCEVLHHIEGRDVYLKKVARALRRGGRVVVIDFHKRALPVGPPPERKIDRAAAVAEFAAAGFRLSAEETFLPYQYFLVFTRER
jgi:ubiquinone/menaquinone biosynthesis C-methylase UbiE